VLEVTEEIFVSALNRMAATKDGQIVLSCLKEYTRFDNDIVVEGKPEDTYANATLRRAYIWLRKRIKPEHLKSIEYDYKRKVETNGTDRATDKPAGKPAKRIQRS